MRVGSRPSSISMTAATDHAGMLPPLGKKHTHTQNRNTETTHTRDDHTHRGGVVRKEQRRPTNEVVTEAISVAAKMELRMVAGGGVRRISVSIATKIGGDDHGGCWRRANEIGPPTPPAEALVGGEIPAARAHSGRQAGRQVHRRRA